MASADPGQRVPDEHVDDAGAAERRAEHDDALGLGRDLPDRAPRRHPTGVRASPAARRRPPRARRPRPPCPRWPPSADRSRGGRTRRSPPGAQGGRPRRGPRPGPSRARARCRRCRRHRAWDRAATASAAPRSSSASTSAPSGAVSERMSLSSERSPRASITAIPWSAMVPETSTTSPGSHVGRRRAFVPSGMTPTPAVVTNMPVGRAAPDHLGVAGDDLARPRPGPRRPCRRRCRAARRSGTPPRSRTPPTASGAPRPAPRGRSRCRAPRGGRWSRPGTAAACTTNESVLNASRAPPASDNVAASGKRAGVAVARTRRGTPSRRAPPTPCRLRRARGSPRRR